MDINVIGFHAHIYAGNCSYTHHFKSLKELGEVLKFSEEDQRHITQLFAGTYRTQTDIHKAVIALNRKMPNHEVFYTTHNDEIVDIYFVLLPGGLRKLLRNLSRKLLRTC